MSYTNPSSKKLSTDEKLKVFLNKSENLEEDNAILDLEYEEARERIRTSSLYGAGAKYRAPKTKKKKKTFKSPFELDLPVEEPKKLLECSSVPPGAHEDQYRRVRFDTEKCRSDPERVFFTTTSMTEGVRTTPQPPWYYGYQNKLKPQDSDPVLCASRYGFRGAKEIAQYLTHPKSEPEATATENTPLFLNTNKIDDEWVPPIQNKPLTNGYAITMPGLWPENTLYPTGSKPNNEIPTSPLYKRETTVGNYSRRPYTSPDVMTKTLGRRTDRTTKILRKSAHMESQNKLESLQRAEQTNFRLSWNDKLQQSANSTLRATMKHEPPPYMAHTLSDPSDRLRYADSTAIITNSTSAEEIVFRQYMEKCREVKPFEMKWNTVISNFRVVKNRLLREQTTKDAIFIISKNLKNEANKHGQRDVITRKQFISAMNKTSYFEHLPMKQMSLLFSMFDFKKKGFICYADLICAFYIFDSPRKYIDNIIELIMELWRLYLRYGNDNPPLETAEKVLTTCCGNSQDEKLILSVFKEKFRPVLYRLAVRCEEEKDIRLSTTSNDVAIHTASAASTARTDRDDVSTAPSTSRSNENAKAAMKQRKEHKGSTIKPAFNIYDRFFDGDMLTSVLEECPEMVDAFREQYEARLVQCYGDVKDNDDVALQHAAEEKDFSWILSKKKNIMK